MTLLLLSGPEGGNSPLGSQAATGTHGSQVGSFCCPSTSSISPPLDDIRSSHQAPQHFIEHMSAKRKGDVFQHGFTVRAFYRLCLVLETVRFLPRTPACVIRDRLVTSGLAKLSISTSQRLGFTHPCTGPDTRLHVRTRDQTPVPFTVRQCICP